MSEVRLGKVFLGWCDSCNLPLLDNRCTICGSRARKVAITPPADYRPAFPEEKERLEKTIRKDFGIELFELDYPLIFNKIPDIDMAKEVIWRGRVIGLYKFDIFRKSNKKEIFLPKVCFAQLLIDLGTKKYVVADDGAISSIKKSSNLLCPGVVDRGNFDAGEEVIVVDREHRVIGVGNAKVSSQNIPERGIAVKVRQRGEPEKLNPPGYKFKEFKEKTVEANREHMEKLIDRAKRFIQSSIKDLPVACSISGGKDSTATLLLLLEAGVKPELLFTDTGLEFKETIDTVHRIAEEYKLKLLEREARTDFFEDLEIFGNPSRDYRWCCKTRKMAPMSYLINENFPAGVLTFIGQRRYESQNREKHGALWRNPWLKKQQSASPIQEWNSMEVWLYIFSRNGYYNPLYELGFERIGCWLCPASDLYDFELYRHKDYERYMDYLRERYDEEAIELGLWRFRKRPGWYNKEIKRKSKAKKDVALIDEGSKIRFFAPEERVRNLGKALGIELMGQEIDVKDEREKEDIRKIIYKAKYCAGCGLCESACENNAIYIDIKENKAWIKEELCTSCGACLSSLCPAAEYLD